PLAAQRAAHREIEGVVPAVGVTIGEEERPEEGIHTERQRGGVAQVAQTHVAARRPGIARLQPATDVDAAAEHSGQLSRTPVVARARDAEDLSPELRLLEAGERKESAHGELVVKRDVAAEIRSTLGAHEEVVTPPAEDLDDRTQYPVVRDVRAEAAPRQVSLQDGRPPPVR